jgi:hypothetical protein
MTTPQYCSNNNRGRITTGLGDHTIVLNRFDSGDPKNVNSSCSSFNFRNVDEFGGACFENTIEGLKGTLEIISRPDNQFKLSEVDGFDYDFLPIEQEFGDEATIFDRFPFHGYLIDPTSACKHFQCEIIARPTSGGNLLRWNKFTIDAETLFTVIEHTDDDCLCPIPGNAVMFSEIKTAMGGFVFGTGTDDALPGRSFSLNTGISTTSQVTRGCYDFLDINTSNEGTVTLNFEPYAVP